MTQPLSTARQRELIDQLSRAAAARAEREAELTRDQKERAVALDARYVASRQALFEKFERAHGAKSNELISARETVFAKYEVEGFTLAQHESRVRVEAERREAEAVANAARQRDSKIRRVEAALAEAEKGILAEFEAFRTLHDQQATTTDALVAEAKKIVARRCPWPNADEPPPILPTGTPKKRHLEMAAIAFEQARVKLVQLNHCPAGQFVEAGWPALLGVFTIFGAGIAAWFAVSAIGWIGVLAIPPVAGIVTGFASRAIGRSLAARRAAVALPGLHTSIQEIRSHLAAGTRAATNDADEARARIAARRDKEVAAAEAEFERVKVEQQTQREARIAKAAADVKVRRQNLEEACEREFREVDETLPLKIAEGETAFRRRADQMHREHLAACAQEKAEFEEKWNALAADWSAALTEFESAIEEMNLRCQQVFPDWSKYKTTDGDPYAPALRFGEYEAPIAGLPNLTPTSERLRKPPTSVRIPAVLSYPDCPSLLIEAEEEGREAAAQTLQNAMLRAMATFPPGKVRFTIVDPVGLGKNFSAFMHLADYDEKLVTNRIWTEQQHIGQRLADLTEHMENVIQKYLRNDFPSILDYNRDAGEVAEPFHILVVANFPAGFTDDAARRLASVATSGARCGVYTFISVDKGQPPPRGFDLADLEAAGTTITWNRETRRFDWKDPALTAMPLECEAPPADEQFTEIVRDVGRRAKEASKVEVPFEIVTPPRESWWTHDSRTGINVPLGRAGAKKLQHMRLGSGTSQHVLIAGKTGSGKSTLLNALIVNSALHYSPEELQLYLIDFKKGVEFKAYAVHRLPHARVIAIESEREFGLSVLERLDLELKQRGEMFRDVSAQDVKGFRAARPDVEMPRVLLIVDEFQEFFTSDDKIAHESSLLLDRLVRQGRAFGIHVLLGSQTLAGAYTLARATISNMAVRIALQCSESDAHLILSEDNSAARLLDRPGEAIYNDSNGRFEGNNPFQIVWLSDQLRESYLDQVAAMAEARPKKLPGPTVFEGNAAADPAENDAFMDALTRPVSAADKAAPRIWFGSAVAIKAPPEFVFRRQGGANVLIVGQQDEMAIGVLANAAIAIVASQRGASSRPNGDSTLDGDDERLPTLTVLDGSRPDGIDAGFWPKLVDRLGPAARRASLRDAPRAIVKLADEVQRRLDASDTTAEPLFLAIYNISRFRELKKGDEFAFGGFSDDDSGVDAGKKLATILREGPAVGVHTLVWADSYANLSRWLDRTAIREFDVRCLFQMSATDSANLMDSPAAGKLGQNFALRFSEELGMAEKFRPYGMPTDEWMDRVRDALQATAPPVEQA